MIDISFEEITKAINDILKKNNLKEALSISIEAHIVVSNHLRPRFSAAVYQREKSPTGGTIFHYVIAEGIESLKFQLVNSIKEKNI